MLPEDKTLAIRWLAEHYRSDAFPEDFLPYTGVAVLCGDTVAAVIPVYLEQSSSVAVLGHCMINEKIKKRIIVQCLQQLIEFAKIYAKNNGKKYIVGIFGRRSINRIADKCSFVNADTIEEKYYYIGGE